MTVYDKWGILTTPNFDREGINNNDKKNSMPKEDSATCRMRSVTLNNSISMTYDTKSNYQGSLEG